jgi:hypothetical protein
VEALLAGVVAAALTFFELDQTFFVPRTVRLKVWCIGGAFLAANAALAICIYVLAKDSDGLSSVPDPLRAAIVGASSLVLVRLKFLTLRTADGTEVPFGFEYFYDELKHTAYGRINRIAGAERRKLALAYAENSTLKQLAQAARRIIHTDQLADKQQQKRLTKWVTDMVENPGDDDLDERFTLADFILSEKAPGNLPDAGDGA